LGFLDAEFNWVMVPYLEKTKYLYQRNYFKAFLKNTKAKTLLATLKKCLLKERLFSTSLITPNWEESGLRILHFSKVLYRLEGGKYYWSIVSGRPRNIKIYT
jgi:hypothetical protein